MSSSNSIKCLGTPLTQKQKLKGSCVSKYVIKMLFNPSGAEEKTNSGGQASTTKPC